MAIDPRRRYPFGQMAPMMYGAGTLNNAAPTFQGPNYYNQMFNRPIQDWSQFMPTNSPLAGGGGINYQLPWGYGTGGGSGWGGAFGGGGGMMGGGLMGGGYGGGYPGWGGGYPGQLGGGNSGGFPPWMNPGNPWAIPIDGSLPGPRPGSDKASDLAAGRTHHPEMYDQNDMWVGAEGVDVQGRGLLGARQTSTGRILGDFTEGQAAAEAARTAARFKDAMPEMTIQQAIEAQQAQTQTANTAAQDWMDPTITGATSTYGTTPMGLLDSQVFDDDPVALATGTGLLGPNEGTINQALNAVGPPGASWNDFSATNPYAGWGPNEFTGANTSPYSGGGDPLANTGGLRHSNVNENVWSQPSMTPTTPAYSTQGDVPTRNVIPNVNVPNTGPPGLAAQQAAAAQAQAQAQQQAYDQNVAVQAQQAAAAQQQRYLANLDDESARNMMNMSQAQQEREAAQVEAAAMSRASGASAAQSSRMAAARSRAGGGNGGGRSGGNGGGRSGGREGGREN